MNAIAPSTAFLYRRFGAHDAALPHRQSVADRQLRGWVQAALGEQPARLTAAKDAPLDALLDAGQRSDLVVVGRGQTHHLSALLHSSIATDLAALAPCPVAVIPAALNTSM